MARGRWRSGARTAREGGAAATATSTRLYPLQRPAPPILLAVFVQ
ncbi:hypothetical protein ACP70R_045630 [Stipagrostis hirtigluma subsp. patula]